MRHFCKLTKLTTMAAFQNKSSLLQQLSACGWEYSHILEQLNVSTNAFSHNSSPKAHKCVFCVNHVVGTKRLFTQSRFQGLISYNGDRKSGSHQMRPEGSGWKVAFRLK